MEYNEAYTSTTFGQIKIVYVNLYIQDLDINIVA